MGTITYRRNVMTKRKELQDPHKQYEDGVKRLKKAKGGKVSAALDFWKVATHPKIGKELSKLSDSDLAEFRKQYETKLDELHSSSATTRTLKRVGLYGNDDEDYVKEGAIREGEKSHKAMKAGKYIPEDDEGAINYPLAEEEEKRSVPIKKAKGD